MSDDALATLFEVDPSALSTIRANEQQLYATEMKLFNNPVWRAHLLFRGSDGIRTTMRDKWANMGLVSALLLTVNVAYIFEDGFQVADWAAGAADGLYAAVRGLMFIASACCMCSIYGSIMLNDLLSTFCPSEADLLYFLNRFDNSAEVKKPPMLVNDPIWFMTAGIALTFLGFLVGYVASSPLFVGVPVAVLSVIILGYGCWFRCWHQLFGTAVPRCIGLYGSLSPTSGAGGTGQGVALLPGQAERA